MAYGMFEADQLSRRSLLRGGAMLGVGSALAGFPMGTAAFAQVDSTTWPIIRGKISEYVGGGKVANMVAALGWGQDPFELISQGTLQIDGLTPANADSLYRIYSMTKPITGIATMMLVEDGELTLDTPLAEILPAFANMQVQKEYDGAITEDNLEPANGPITIRQLLTHTAGLGYGIVQTGPIKQAYESNGVSPGQVSRIPIPGIGRAEPAESLEKFADELAKLPLVYQPGTKWSYSVGLDLLGRVIEVVSGMSFDAFLSQRLFQPCGMDSTWFKVPASEVSRFTTNYAIFNGIPLPIDPAAGSIYLDDPAFPFGGAGLVSSPSDYDRFLRMLVGKGEIDGTRVMEASTVEIATSDILPSTADVTGTWVEGQRFGAGGRVTGTAFGWGGAAGTAAFADMESGLRAAMFTQYMPSNAYPIQQDFPRWVLQDLAKMQSDAAAAEAAEAVDPADGAAQPAEANNS
ncbi:serine hydrolase domain-containing protein [Pontixanthobacter aquaemixtae]|uniref:Serine hydrolase n=1 Tax=Pontixanthobacter aquaemixtae TaxID=1958940 RepID=A0A844ZTU1_9SPHN|nr:serine hydrolase domain-containing protein [Pontixanthobacter aquaemixtae]MXO90712.1 serine hydrolase [Pontixanthobacter aquaemixtae]